MIHIPRLILRFLDKHVISLSPKKYRLLCSYIRYVYLSRYEPEIKHINKFIDGSGIALDIGANRGLWTYALSNNFHQVIAFEPNPNVTNDLLNAGLDNVLLIHKALSDLTKEEILHIPNKGGIEMSGWASLEEKFDIEIDYIKEIKVSTSQLDDYGFTDVSFIKIDVEGHELKVLEGGKKTLEINRPVCLVEIKKNNFPNV